MACRFGACEINNNRPKPKKPTQKAKKGKSPVAKCPSSDWSESDDSCSGCSACWESSSSCSCSECNMETDSDEPSYVYACGPKGRKPAKKLTKSKKVTRVKCTDDICPWVSKAKKLKKPAEKNNGKTKKTKTPKKCYECC